MSAPKTDALPLGDSPKIGASDLTRATTIKFSVMFSRNGVASFLLLSLTSLANAAEPLRVVTTIAGTPGVPGFQDGPAAVAMFNKPTWLDIVTSTRTSDYSYKIELGDIFVVDRQNNALRKISRRTVYTEIVRRNYYD